MSSDTNEQQQQLQESFLQQQEKISALKELVRKSGAAHGSSKSAAQEKVKNLAERLFKSKAKSRQGLNVSTYTTEPNSTESSFTGQEQANVMSMSQGQFPMQSPTPSFASTPNPTPNPTPTKPEVSFRRNDISTSSIPSALQSSEKIALMRHQLEQNKLRMAQKASSKQHLEQLVSQLKDKFETTQQYLEDTTEMGRSMSDLSNIVHHHTTTTRERYKSATDLSSQHFSLEKERIKFLENRCRLLEKQLEKEKQNNQRMATTTTTHVAVNSETFEAKISELELALKQKEQEWEARENSLKEELKKLQKSREITDFEASEENTKLLNENETLKLEIERLNNAVNNNVLQEQIEQLNQENSQLKQQLETLSKQLEVFASEGNEETGLNENENLHKEIENLKKQLEAFKSKESVESLDILNENNLLKQETETQLERIHELNEINDVLETTRCDMTSKCTELEEQIKQLQSDLLAGQENLKLAEEKCQQLQNSENSNTKGTSSINPADTDSQLKLKWLNKYRN